MAPSCLSVQCAKLRAAEANHLGGALSLQALEHGRERRMVVLFHLSVMTRNLSVVSGVGGHNGKAEAARRRIKLAAPCTSSYLADFSSRGHFWRGSDVGVRSEVHQYLPTPAQPSRNSTISPSLKLKDKHRNEVHQQPPTPSQSSRNNAVRPSLKLTDQRCNNGVVSNSSNTSAVSNSSNGCRVEKTTDSVLSRVLKNSARLKDVWIMPMAHPSPNTSADQRGQGSSTQSKSSETVRASQAVAMEAVAEGEASKPLEAAPCLDARHTVAFVPRYTRNGRLAVAEPGGLSSLDSDAVGEDLELGKEHVWTLNGLLVEAGTVQALLDAVGRWKGRMTPLNACTAFHRVAKWTLGLRKDEQLAIVEDGRVRWLADEVERHLPSYLPRALTNIAWAHSRLGHGSPHLMEKIAEAAILRAGGFQLHETVILMHAFAKAGEVVSRPLFQALLDATLTASPQLEVFAARDLKDIAWSHARLGLSSPDLFRAIAAAALPKIDDFGAQSLATIAWSYAKLGCSAEELFRAVAVRGESQMECFTPQDVSNLAWAYAKAGVHSPNLMDSLAERALATLPEFGPQALSNTAWAFGTLRHRHEVLFDAVAEEILRKLDLFSPQALSNSVWSYAVLSHSCPRLLEAIGRTAIPLLPNMTDLSLHTLAFAFATLDHAAPALFEAISAELLRRLKQGEGQENAAPRKSMVMLAWAMVVRGHICPNLFPELRTHLSQGSDYSSHDLCQLYQVELALQLEAPEIGEARLGLQGKSANTYFNDLWLSGYTKQQAKICWQRENEIEKRQVSDFQGQVARSLRSMGLPTLEEYRDGDYSIDVAILPPSPSFAKSPYSPLTLQRSSALDKRGGEGHGWPKIAIEADGPSHFAYNGARLPLGPTNLKARLLRRLGWHVVQIAYYEWKDLRSEAERVAYLTKALGSKLDMAIAAHKESLNLQGQEWDAKVEVRDSSERCDGGGNRMGEKDECSSNVGRAGEDYSHGRGQEGRQNVLVAEEGGGVQQQVVLQRARQLRMIGLMLQDKPGRGRQGIRKEKLVQEVERRRRGGGVEGGTEHVEIV